MARPRPEPRGGPMGERIRFQVAGPLSCPKRAGEGLSPCRGGEGRKSPKVCGEEREGGIVGLRVHIRIGSPLPQLTSLTLPLWKPQRGWSQSRLQISMH
ncbi:hypothetical protein SRHO_G00078950 [Serrasalmus rhombeus]